MFKNTPIRWWIWQGKKRLLWLFCHLGCSSFLYIFSIHFPLNSTYYSSHDVLVEAQYSVLSSSCCTLQNTSRSEPGYLWLVTSKIYILLMICLKVYQKNSRGPFCIHLRQVEGESHFLFLLRRCIDTAPPPSEGFLHLTWVCTASRIGGTSPGLALPPWLAHIWLSYDVVMSSCDVMSRWH